jgi:nucleoside 2-deoxyribosyltransferase
MKKIYLAGGMAATWQDQVIAARPDVKFMDPRSHGLKSEIAYTKWDLDAVNDSDLIFAYMTAVNPSGIGMSLEVGFARALGKEIWFVQDELGDRDHRSGACRSTSHRSTRHSRLWSNGTSNHPRLGNLLRLGLHAEEAVDRGVCA